MLARFCRVLFGEGESMSLSAAEATDANTDVTRFMLGELLLQGVPVSLLLLLLRGLEQSRDKGLKVKVKVRTFS